MKKKSTVELLAELVMLFLALGIVFVIFWWSWMRQG